MRTPGGATLLRLVQQATQRRHELRHPKAAVMGHLVMVNECDQGKVSRLWCSVVRRFSH